MTFPRASRLGLTTVALLLSVTVGANATPAKEPVAAQNAGDPIATAIDEASRRFGIPEAWIRAVMRVESNGDRRAVSRAGAIGLMQVMPATYAELRRQLGIGMDPFDVRNNILAGTAYLRQMYDRYGAPGFLAAYNAGPGRWESHLDGSRPLPTETVNYLSRLAPALGFAAVDSASEPAARRPPSPFEAPLFVRANGVSAAQSAPSDANRILEILVANPTRVGRDQAPSPTTANAPPMFRDDPSVATGAAQTSSSPAPSRRSLLPAESPLFVARNEARSAQ